MIDYHARNRNLARLSDKVVVRKVMSSIFFGHMSWYMYTPSGGQFELGSHRQAVALAHGWNRDKRGLRP